MAKRGICLGVFFIVAGSLASGCARPAQSAPKAAPPATMAQIAKEDQLNTIKLTEEAEGRIGLQTAAVEQRKIHRQRSYPGEVTLPASALLMVSAPVSGTLQVVKGHELPRDGAAVRKGQAMFSLVPHAITQAEVVAMTNAQLLLSQAQVDAEGQVRQAQVQADAADIALKRAQKLFKSQSITKKEVDDADAAMQLAEKVLAAANEKKKLVDSMKLETDTNSVKALVIPAPRSGIVKATHAVAGQVLAAGSALFEIMNVETVWIRVPIYVGELADVAERESAHVKNLSDAPGTAGVEAKAVDAPPTAVPAAAAVDLYYELHNPEGKYRPGQRVAVQVPLRSEEKNLGVPWSAVVQDIYGGSWVYVQTAPHTYVRQRVLVSYVAGDWAVLSVAPPAGTKVVTAGTAEIFGSEFGFGK